MRATILIWVIIAIAAAAFLVTAFSPGSDNPKDHTTMEGK